MRKVHMPIFVGERYLPHARQDVALDEAERIRAAVSRLAPGGSPVRLLSTTYVPNEEWVFDLFEATSADEVQQVYAECGVAVERVTEGVHLPGS
jgi:hypothetical protein